MTATLRLNRVESRLGLAVRVQPNGDCYSIRYLHNVLVFGRHVGGSFTNINQIVCGNTPEYANGTIHTIRVTSYTDGSFKFWIGNVVGTWSGDSDSAIPLDGGACGLRAEQNVGDNNNLSDLDIQII